MSTMLFRFIAAVVVAAMIEAYPIPEEKIPSYLSAKKDIVAFFNVYANGSNYDRIVQEQVATIKGSGLLDKLDNVYYATMGQQGLNYEFGNSSKYVHLAHYGGVGSEMHTMNYLWQFCQSNPTSKVLYFHDKGSYHSTVANERLRNYLNCFVLNTHCISTLDDHDICGWRVSPIHYIHYSGNFWWARCSYVRNLVDPLSSVNNQTYIALAKPYKCYRLLKRYAAESWIGSGPRVHPADCMNATIDSSFLYGYKVSGNALQYCPGPDKPAGLPCQTASTLTNVKEFDNAFRHANNLNYYCDSARKEVIDATRWMYNDLPHTYLAWRDSLPKPTKSLILQLSTHTERIYNYFIS